MNSVELEIVTAKDGTKTAVPKNKEMLAVRRQTVPYDPRFPNTNQTKFVLLFKTILFFTLINLNFY